MVDVTVGGYDLPYQLDGFLTVWIVTINGRVRTADSLRCDQNCTDRNSVAE